MKCVKIVPVSHNNPRACLCNTFMAFLDIKENQESSRTILARVGVCRYYEVVPNRLGKNRRWCA